MSTSSSIINPDESKTAVVGKSSLLFSSINGIEWLSEPIVVRGIVQRGFGRGSRDLGTPTANLPGALLDSVENAWRDGVYLGFGRVPKLSKSVFKMVANLGHNITYGDVDERILEAFLMSDSIKGDFYGEEMRLCIIGYMRPEWKFSSPEELILHIRNDVTVATNALDLEQARKYSNHDSF